MKTAKTLLAAAVLAGFPGLATAMCFGDKHQTTAQSCAPGHVLDAESGTCVPEVTG